PVPNGLLGDAVRRENYRDWAAGISFRASQSRGQLFAKRLDQPRMIVPVFDEVHVHIGCDLLRIIEQMPLVKTDAGAGILGRKAKRDDTLNPIGLDLPDRFGDKWLPVAHPEIDRPAKQRRQALRL